MIVKHLNLQVCPVYTLTLFIGRELNQCTLGDKNWLEFEPFLGCANCLYTNSHLLIDIGTFIHTQTFTYRKIPVMVPLLEERKFAITLRKIYKNICYLRWMTLPKDISKL